MFPPVVFYLNLRDSPCDDDNDDDGVSQYRAVVDRRDVEGLRNTTEKLSLAPVLLLCTSSVNCSTGCFYPHILIVKRYKPFQNKTEEAAIDLLP